MISFQFLIKYRSKLIFLYNANPIRIIISLPFIVFPVEGLKVLELIFSSLGNRQNMINFPTELAILAKGRFNHHGTASIFPEFFGIRSSYGVSFSPNSFNNGGSKLLAKFIRIPFPFHAQLLLFSWSKIAPLLAIISLFYILALVLFLFSIKL
ncbi:MAG: hypothetical protein AMJ94_00435 [Deltaproteobacteria bacterium SM23_61]|nr:MAG: hypothetical protein AMJ94_00435 [Deltaproteobacteria bacterium SM23_61]